MIISLTTTAAQDAILERLRVKTNSDRAAQNPPLSALADIPALVTSIMTSAVVSYRQQQIAEDITQIGAAYDAGNNTLRAAIRNAAGV